MALFKCLYNFELYQMSRAPNLAVSADPFAIGLLVIYEGKIIIYSSLNSHCIGLQ